MLNFYNDHQGTLALNPRLRRRPWWRWWSRWTRWTRWTLEFGYCTSLRFVKTGEKILFSSSTFNIQHLEDPLAWEGQRAEGHQLVLAFCLCLTPFFRLVIKFFVLPFRAVKCPLENTSYRYFLQQQFIRITPFVICKMYLYLP